MEEILISTVPEDVQHGVQLANFIEFLPSEIQLNCLKRLSPESLINLSQTLKANHFFQELCTDNYLWQLLILRRFGISHIRDEGIDHNAANIYRELAHNRFYPLAKAIDFEITWGNDSQYWKTINDETSISKKIKELRSGIYNLSGVRKGVYQPVWRLKLDHPNYVPANLSDIEFSMKVVDHELDPGAYVSVKFESVFSTVPLQQWFDFKLPVISVGQGYSDDEFYTVKCMV
ncbi:hypothetical protein HK096_009652 [Nowakowskiella sp. JEL0078]|nr:hypothetical protein HK096_009652 [Nowakowskiella sp. JEL0078]